ncbi:hypothetical protein [Psychrobacter sp. DAB_AL43B]|uniref:hypothetical protein n=1 Tax=Psychrobacter sp. DAB_AL43B TaxID=1028416 RepID=UPI0009A6FCD9|nr:hypothetical protein [Psychrobacter sp. DAB_AL43B]SLJ84915.1 hypothetical protein DABAL43B_1720 [Psychrobacter sp. DAB_AL43B]
MIKIYGNYSNKSGIEAYEVNDESITIHFKGGGIYLYNYFATGITHIIEMKRLAVTGNGLNSYISKNVKDNYVKRLA